MASRHAIRAGSTLEVLEADTTNMDTALLGPQPSSSPGLLCLDAVREVKIIKPVTK
jgi:hypothetical protein